MIKSLSLRISPLLISLLIYVFYRSELTLINQAIGIFLPLADLLKYQEQVQTALPLPNWIIYSLPEGLWVLFVTLISKEFYFTSQSKNYSLVFFPILLAICIEVFQYFQLTDGTFDWLDLGVALFFWGLTCFLLPPRFNILQLKNAFNIRGILLISSYLIVILSDVF
mgnify:CR=1 FL=1|tara:strand:+ start:55 stop:555 length:501 start_codon:yes stop_codon:yes gene_type:complete